MTELCHLRYTCVKDGDYSELSYDTARLFGNYLNQRSIETINKYAEYVKYGIAQEYFDDLDGYSQNDWANNFYTFRIWTDPDNYKDFDIMLKYEPSFFVTPVKS